MINIIYVLYNLGKYKIIYFLDVLSNTLGMIVFPLPPTDLASFPFPINQRTPPYSLPISSFISPISAIPLSSCCPHGPMLLSGFCGYSRLCSYI